MKEGVKMLEYLINKEKENLQIFVKGDLDLDGTETIYDELIPKMLTYKRVNLDLEHVSFVDSSGVGLLMSIVHTLSDNEVVITISNVQKEVFEIFELLQIPEILGEEIFVQKV